jgi:Proliferating cell nuclear antigen, C-terminal domain
MEQRHGQIQSVNQEQFNFSYSSAVSRSWTLPSLEPVEEEVPEPKLSFKTKVKMETAMFQQVMEDVTTVSDHVKVSVNNEGQMQIIGQGDLMSAAITLTKDQGLLEVDGAEELHVVSSNIFVTEIAKAVKPNSIMTLELATDMPLKFTFSGFLEEPTENNRLLYYVAPRIETDNK